MKGTSNYGIQYDRSSDFTLSAYSSVDWGGNIDFRKNTNGGVFFLGGRLVSWLSKKHDCILHSTIEAEYIATKNNCNQVLWMKPMLKYVGIQFTAHVVIHYDNTSTISMSKNLLLHSKTKNISIMF